MVQKYADLIDKVTIERQYLDDKTKKTKYARPGYKYIEAHSKADGIWYEVIVMLLNLIG